MNGYRLLIVDFDAVFAKRAADFLSASAGFRIVGMVADGVAAREKIKTAKPDVILLDPLLPGIDGVTLMKTIQTMKKPPVVVCASESYTSIGIELARRSGASYYVYKPIHLESLASILTSCCSVASERNIVERTHEEISLSSELSRSIHNLLHELGFSFKLKGSEYIAKSIELAKQSPMALHNLSTGVYRKMAEELHISPESIERSIRTAIAAVDSDGKLTEKIGSAPTNKNCIRYLLRELEMQN